MSCIYYLGVIIVNSDTSTQFLWRSIVRKLLLVAAFAIACIPVWIAAHIYFSTTAEAIPAVLKEVMCFSGDRMIYSDKVADVTVQGNTVTIMEVNGAKVSVIHGTCIIR